MTRQHKELLAAIELARRAAGRVESRERLAHLPHSATAYRPLHVGLYMADRNARERMAA